MKLCVGNDPERELQQMQVYHDAAVGVVLSLWALDRDHARRIGARAEQALRRAGCHVRGRFYRVAPAELEAILRQSAKAERLSLMSDNERLSLIVHQADRSFRRAIGR